MFSVARLPKIAKSFCIVLSSKLFLRWSPFGGLLLFKYIWDFLEIPLILGRVGLGKVRGAPAHVLAFTLLVGFWTRQPSVAAVVRLWYTDPLLQWMTCHGVSVSESNVSRFLNQPESRWYSFYDEVVANFQALPGRGLVPGTVIVVDDSKILHPHAKKNPLLHRSKEDDEWVWGKNTVTSLVIPPDNREYLAAFRYWEKGGPSKLQLAENMLTHLAKSTSATDIWVTFDSWYFAYPLCPTIEDLGLNWVSRAKNSQVFYVPYTGPKRPGRGRQKQWEKLKISSVIESLEIPQNAPLGWYHDFGTVYVARRVDGKIKRFPIRLILVLGRKNEGSDEKTILALVSNHLEKPADYIVQVYKKRWRTEVFYRHAKQDLSLGKCHSPKKEAAIAHTALCLTADLILRLAANPDNGSSFPVETPSGAWMDSIIRRSCYWDRRTLRKPKVIFQASQDPSIDLRISAMSPSSQKLTLWAS